MSRRRFTDRAGYTRHCWECKHAKNWRTDTSDQKIADCELTGETVEKTDSPNNLYSRLPVTCSYERW
jgi:hypothetical protein